MKRTQKNIKKTENSKWINQQTFSFDKPLSLEYEWMLGLTSLEISKSIFNITKENNKF